MTTHLTEYRYHLKGTGSSSARFGDCECCGKPVSDVWSQTEEASFPLDEIDIADPRYADPSGIGWTQHGCTTLFGHRECLISARRSVDA